MFVHGSLKSATHLVFKLRLRLRAIRWVVCGGPVEIMTSTGFSFRYCVRNFTEGRIHKNRASGMKKFPRIQTEIFCASDGLLFSDKKPEYTRSSFFWPTNFL